MKKHLSWTLITLSLTLTFSSSLLAQNKVIYGDDNRVDAHLSSNDLFKRLARSTAAMIPVEKVTLTAESTTASIQAESLTSMINLCSTEPFAEQITAAMCSGFLVAPDLLVTAGHCIKNESDCQENRWVFDYAVGENSAGASATEMVVPASSVYSCKQIVATKLSWMDKTDFAVVRLDRAVTDRAPLAYRQKGSKIPDGAELVVIGHPSGLPTKIADGAFIRDNNNPVYFIANLDTYGGNSGSAVFNAQTGEVEGILVRGENDYVEEAGCMVSNRCPAAGCRGEDVTRITVVEGI